MIDTPIVIVGAGPVGLCCALRLAQGGIQAVVLEAADKFPEDLRASTFHPPTLDMLDDVGVGAAFIAMGRKAPTWRVTDFETGKSVLFDIDVISDQTRHPYRLQCEQLNLTQLLYAHVMRLGLTDVRFGAQAVAVEQSNDQVTIQFEHQGETRELKSRIVIGSDGARSIVRESVGLSLEGSTYPAVNWQVTSRFDFDGHVRDLAVANYLWTKFDSGSLLHLPDEWRVTLYPREGDREDVMLSDEAIHGRLSGICPGVSSFEVREKSAYRIHQRIVPTYRIGRVVLAGDAAHLNAPTGGMGLNGGIHDAFNLSDKIMRVLAGDPDSLLDLYSRQRRPIAFEEIIQQADQTRKRMQVRDLKARLDIIKGLRELTGDHARLHSHMLKASMIEGLNRSAQIA